MESARVGARVIPITVDEIRNVCHLSREAAAKELGISKNTLNARIRECQGLPGWRGLHDYFVQRGGIPSKTVRLHSVGPKKILLTIEEIRNVCHLSREAAAKELRVSPMTLTRRLLELDIKMTWRSINRGKGMLELPLHLFKSHLIISPGIPQTQELPSKRSINRGKGMLELPLPLFKSHFIISPGIPQTQELPPNWATEQDATSGRIYYVDHEGQKTTWEHPGEIKADFHCEGGFAIAGVRPSAERFQLITDNTVACSSAFINMQPSDSGTLFTVSVHFCGNETGGGTILLKNIAQGEAEQRAGLSAALLQRVNLEVWIKLVERESSKDIIQKFLSRSDISAKKAQVASLEITRQHAVGVAGHVDMAEHFGTKPALYQPPATGLNGGTAEYEFSIQSIAEDKVHKLMDILNRRKTLAFSGEAVSFENFNFERGLRHKRRASQKNYLELPPGPAGTPGAANLRQTCPGINEWTGKVALNVLNGDVLEFATAIFCGHTPYGPNQYFDRLDDEGTAMCALGTNSTSKRIRADDPREGAHYQYVVKKKKLTIEEALREAIEPTESKSGLKVEPLKTHLQVRWEVQDDYSPEASSEVVW